MVTKRAGNRWAVNATYYYSGGSLQSTNTPQELIDNPILNPITGLPAEGSDRTDSVHDFGFNVGGPVVKDKLFLWGAYHNYFTNVFNIHDELKKTLLTDYNAKINVNWNTANESQVGYFLGLKYVGARLAFGTNVQSPESIWVQDTKPDGGMWSAQHTWIPNDQFLLTARYGYIGNGWSLIPPGGKDVPMIYLAAIPYWESTLWYLEIEHPCHNVTADINYFNEELLGADHEFKFGFEYKNSSFRTFSSYGNGVMITDFYQTTPGGPLTQGYFLAQHYVDGRMNMNRASFYVTDTVRKDRLTLNLGFRFDHQTGKNGPSSVPGIPGFEQDVGPLVYEGGDPGITFNNVSPRLGATFDLTGDGKTVLRANFARYYDAYDPNYFVASSNPTYVYNGAFYDYVNKNGDRIISPDEITGGPYYFGGLTRGAFDLEAFLASRHYADDLSNPWTNEVLVGFERELTSSLTISAIYTYRKYGNLLAKGIPFGITTSDFVPAGNYSETNILGDFNVPYFTLGIQQDGSTLTANIKDMNQTYNGIDFLVRKRMSQNFMLNAALTLQRQKAHTDGNDSLGFVSTGIVAFDPTNLPFVNDKSYAYSEGNRGRVNLFGAWNLRVAGVYQLPWNLATSAYLRYQQGYPYILFARVEDPNLRSFYGPRHNILVEPIGSRRLDNVFTVDLQIQKIFDLNPGRISLILDVFNVTNANTVVSRNNALGTESLNQIGEVLSPRAARLGITFSF